jgi:hypothetical protein
LGPLPIQAAWNGVKKVGSELRTGFIFCDC